jgi:hypothetical protein
VNEKGKEVVTQTNLDFILTYQDTEEASATGYELSLVSHYTTKTNEFEILAKNNGKAISTDKIKTTEHNKLITFDVFNTNEYSIEVYKNVRKPAMLRNEDLMNWISKCDAKRDKNPTSYLLTYTSEPKDGKVGTTLIAYRTGLNCVTDLTIIPTGETGTLELQLQYSHDDEKRLDQKNGDINYNLYYFRITTDEDVDFTYTIMSNGEVEAINLNEQVEARTEKNGDADPDFEIIGTLDTELVKYMYDLNNKLVAKLDACQNLDEMKAVIAELKLLLCSDPEIPPVASDFTILADVVAEYVKDGSLADFHRNTLCITTYEAVTFKEQHPENPLEQIDASYKDTVGNTEEYIYFSSPYAIYRGWM